MVREDQIASAAVDIDLFAERGVNHGGAFDMPTGTPLAPRRFPKNLACLRRLPQREIVRIFLAAVVFDAHAVEHILFVAPRKLPVRGIRIDVEIHVAVAPRIRVPLFDERRNKIDDRLNVFGRFEPDRRIADIGLIASIFFIIMRAYSSAGMPVSLERAMILSSTSV